MNNPETRATLGTIHRTLNHVLMSLGDIYYVVYMKRLRIPKG